MFGYPGIDLQDKCWLLMGKYNLKMLILTCGVNGSYVFTPGHCSFVDTPKVDVVDTVELETPLRQPSFRPCSWDVRWMRHTGVPWKCRRMSVHSMAPCRSCRSH